MSLLPGLWTLLGYSLLPTAGALAGGLLADRLDLPKRWFGFMLHVAVGVVLGVVAIELMPLALSRGPRWVVLAAFLGGGLFFVGIDRLTDAVRTAFGAEDADGRGGAAPWVLAIGIGIDLFTDGLMIGVGSSLVGSLGLLFGLALLVVDLPEGFATVSVLKRGGVSRRKRLWLIGGLSLSIPLGALTGHLLRGQPEALLVGILAFTGGILATLMVEELVPQSHKGTDVWQATLFFLLGLGAFIGITLLVGG